MPGDDTPDELRERLELAYRDEESPALERVIREASDELVANAHTLDYPEAIRATDGDVALEIDVNHSGRAAIRGHGAVPRDVDATYQLAGERDEARVTTVETSGVHALLASYPVEPVLHRDVADLFDDATEIETADPLTRL